MLAWNPWDSQWGVVWEEFFDIDPDRPGVSQRRLFYGRVDANGRWIGERLFLSSPTSRGGVTLTDWMNEALVWNGRAFATVLIEHTKQASTLMLLEISPDGTATRTPIGSKHYFSRPHLAFDGQGYGIVFQQRRRGDPDRDGGVRFVYVRDGEVFGPVDLGRKSDGDTNEAALTYDGRRFTAAWHINPRGKSRGIGIARISVPGPKVHDRSRFELDPADDLGLSTLRWNGCRHAMTFTPELNGPDGWISLFP